MTWSEVVHRVVLVQRTTRLCAARDLDEADIVGRIMRKDNYLWAAPQPPSRGWRGCVPAGMGCRGTQSFCVHQLRAKQHS